MSGRSFIDKAKLVFAAGAPTFLNVFLRRRREPLDGSVSFVSDLADVLDTAPPPADADAAATAAADASMAAAAAGSGSEPRRPPKKKPLTDVINLDFLLLHVMGILQPLDWATFTRNEAAQPLVVVASSLRSFQVPTPFSNPVFLRPPSRTPLSLYVFIQPVGMSRQRWAFLMLPAPCSGPSPSPGSRSLTWLPLSLPHLAPSLSLRGNWADLHSLLGCIRASMAVPGLTGALMALAPAPAPTAAAPTDAPADTATTTSGDGDGSRASGGGLGPRVPFNVLRKHPGGGFRTSLSSLASFKLAALMPSPRGRIAALLAGEVSRSLVCHCVRRAISHSNPCVCPW